MKTKEDYHEELGLASLRTGIRQLVQARGIPNTIVQLEAHISGLRVLRTREFGEERPKDRKGNIKLYVERTTKE